MNYTKTLAHNAEAIERLQAEQMALRSLVSVLAVRSLLGSGDQWRDSLNDLFASAGYDIAAAPGAEGVRASAQQILDATRADMQKMMQAGEALGFPDIMGAH